MQKITLNADELFIIRSVKTSPEGVEETRYYESPSVWNSAPTKATMFTDFEIGEAHLNMMAERDVRDSSWADGSTEVFDVVPLFGEILNSPNAVMITKA